MGLRNVLITGCSVFALLELDPTKQASLDAAAVIVPTLDADLDIIRDMFEVNILGFIRVTQAFASHVINAQGTTPWMGICAGSKAAVTQFSDTLRMELKPFGVKVVTVQTGAVATKTLSWAKDFKLEDEIEWGGWGSALNA